MRIVSLLPSATEIVCALGLQDQLVGVTHECDYPAGVESLAKVTRTLIPHDAASAEIDALVRERLQTSMALYSLDEEALASLKPDLIVTQALCGVCAVAENEVTAAADRLAVKPRVLNLEPQTLPQVLEAIKQVGEAAGVPDRAADLVASMRGRIGAVEARSAAIRGKHRVLMLEWLDPPFCAGHWNPELVRLAGGRECLGEEGKPSRTITWEEITAADPEMLFIACCGFDIERTLQDAVALGDAPHWNALSAVRSGKAYVACGSQYFNRPGPRLADSLEILAHALYPELHPLPARLSPAVPVESARGSDAPPVERS